MIIKIEHGTFLEDKAFTGGHVVVACTGYEILLNKDSDLTITIEKLSGEVELYEWYASELSPGEKYMISVRVTIAGEGELVYEPAVLESIDSEE